MSAEIGEIIVGFALPFLALAFVVLLYGYFRYGYPRAMLIDNLLLLIGVSSGAAHIAWHDPGWTLPATQWVAIALLLGRQWGRYDATGRWTAPFQVDRTE